MVKLSLKRNDPNSWIYDHRLELACIMIGLTLTIFLLGNLSSPTGVEYNSGLG